MVPDHPPEVLHCVGKRALCGNVVDLPIRTLDREREKEGGGEGRGRGRREGGGEEEGGREEGVMMILCTSYRTTIDTKSVSDLGPTQ